MAGSLSFPDTMVIDRVVFLLQVDSGLVVAFTVASLSQKIVVASSIGDHHSEFISETLDHVRRLS
jgi:hypothetical protein